jgi:hypothetical protein
VVIGCDQGRDIGAQGNDDGLKGVDRFASK